MPTMKAVVFKGKGHIAVEDVPKPRPRTGEAVIRITTTTICGTDVHLTPLITHHFALDDIEAAFDVFSSQRDGVLKVALHPSPLKRDRVPDLASACAVDEP